MDTPKGFPPISKDIDEKPLGEEENEREAMCLPLDWFS